MWEEIGKLQFDFLRGQGLLPKHTMFDVGCGILRAGRHFIGFLEPRNYTGIDISPEAIKHAERLVAAEDLADKQPRLIVNEHKRLTFDQFRGETFDFILAQSVFTHLMIDIIIDCFNYIGNIMNWDSRFYFTCWDESLTGSHREYINNSAFDFIYTTSVFEALAAEHDFSLEDHSAEYPHPRGQRMLRITKKA